MGIDSDLKMQLEGLTVKIYQNRVRGIQVEKQVFCFALFLFFTPEGGWGGIHISYKFSIVLNSANYRSKYVFPDVSFFPYKKQQKGKNYEAYILLHRNYKSEKSTHRKK